MKALVFGTQPEPWTPPAGASALRPATSAHARGAARGARRAAAAARLGGHPAPAHRHLRLRLQAGVHGLGRGRRRQPDERRSSRCRRCSGTRSSPTWSRSGPRPKGFEVGDRVVLNPWLSCAPRGVDADLPGVRGRRLQPVLDFTDGADRARASTSARRATPPAATRSYARARLACCSRCPTTCPTSSRCSPTRSRCRCTRSPGTRRRRAARSLVYGAGALGTCATAILRALYPDVEVLVVARFEAQADAGAQARRARVIGHAPALRGDRGGGGVVGRRAARRSDGLPMALPGLHRRRVRHRRQAGDASRSTVRVLKARGTLVKAGVHGPTWWEDTPLYFKEISMVGSNAFGFEEVDGVRKHGIEHYLDLVADGRVDLTGHAHAHVPARRLARRVHGARHPGRHRRDQGRLRPAERGSHDHPLPADPMALVCAMPMELRPADEAAPPRKATVGGGPDRSGSLDGPARGRDRDGMGTQLATAGLARLLGAVTPPRSSWSASRARSTTRRRSAR